MREIHIPAELIQRYFNDPQGIAMVVPVKVDWPELRLTEGQVLANAFALANGENPPFDDPSIFTVVVPRIVQEKAPAHLEGDD